jgi:DNA repair exonuclease SbcCD ATPase subunit
MTNAELIVEQLLGLTEEVSTGIFMKQLDSGRQVYSCKCPVCGTIHGGFRTYGEAEAHKKCREHHRKEVEKTRKEIEKVDEPKKQKNIFQSRLNKPAVIGESTVNENEQEDRDVAAILGKAFSVGRA